MTITPPVADGSARGERGFLSGFSLSLALIKRTGNRWFSWIGFAFHQRTRANFADSFVLIEHTNFGRRQRCLAGGPELTKVRSGTHKEILLTGQ
jgi:hypothetical protein